MIQIVPANRELHVTLLLPKTYRHGESTNLITTTFAWHLKNHFIINIGLVVSEKDSTVWASTTKRLLLYLEPTRSEGKCILALFHLNKLNMILNCRRNHLFIHISNHCFFHLILRHQITSFLLLSFRSHLAVSNYKGQWTPDLSVFSNNYFVILRNNQWIIDARYTNGQFTGTNNHHIFVDVNYFQVKFSY